MNAAEVKNVAKPFPQFVNGVREGIEVDRAPATEDEVAELRAAVRWATMESQARDGDHVKRLDRVFYALCAVYNRYDLDGTNRAHAARFALALARPQ